MQRGADLIHFKASSSNNIARFNELLRVASSRNTRSRSSDVDNHHRTAAAFVNVESDLVNASIKKCLFSATGAIRRLEFLLANPRVKDNLRANAMKIVRVRMHQRMTVSRKMQMDASLCTRTKLLLQTKRRLYHQTKTTKEMGETKRNEERKERGPLRLLCPPGGRAAVFSFSLLTFPPSLSLDPLSLSLFCRRSRSSSGSPPPRNSRSRSRSSRASSTRSRTLSSSRGASRRRRWPTSSGRYPSFFFTSFWVFLLLLLLLLPFLLFLLLLLRFFTAREREREIGPLSRLPLSRSFPSHSNR